MKLTEILYKVVLNEGRIEDAQQYFEKAVGDWPVALAGNPVGIGPNTNIEGVLEHFVKSDPSGNNKYLMWMVKQYLSRNESLSPDEISRAVIRFHRNLDMITPELIANMGDAGHIRSPKDINDYASVYDLYRVGDSAEDAMSRKQTEDKAKKGAEKLFEDDRWLVVKPHTLESSCYYGAGTKWCTTEKDSDHFKDYTAKGPLYYIIDKSRQLGRFYKIALHVTWDGQEEFYDEKDKLLEKDVLDAIKNLLPKAVLDSTFNDWENTGKPEKELMSLGEFRTTLTRYVENTRNQQTIKTNSGIWRLYINQGVWYWFSTPDSTQTNDNIIEVQATPFHNNLMEFPFDSHDIKNIDSPDPWSITFGADFASKPNFKPEQYLDPEPTGWMTVEGNVKTFLNSIYRPLVKQVLDGKEVQETVGGDYTTWDTQSWVSSYAFKYPPKKGTMTQKFTDYLKQNPKRTSNQFYEDVLGYSRPRGHNSMFFAAIKDAGIVKIERQGRQFVYSLGPNYPTWTEGRLLRAGRKYG